MTTRTESPCDDAGYDPPGRCITETPCPPEECLPVTEVPSPPPLAETGAGDSLALGFAALVILVIGLGLVLIARGRA